MYELRKESLSFVKGIGNRVNKDILVSLKELQAAQRMSKIMPVYFPITHYTIRNIDLEQILNTITFSNSQYILEIGSGLSTLVIGNYFKNAGVGKIVSLENDTWWIDMMERLIKDNGLNNVEIRHAELADFSMDGVSGSWFNEPKIADEIFDGILIDGPPAFKKGLEMSRYPAIRFLKNNLKSGGFFYLDDVNRQGEINCLNKWSQQVKFTSTTASKFGKGQLFYKQ